jgi:sporulation protein YlmC with PRC-barrel domain
MPRFRFAASVASLAALVAIAASAQDEPRVRVQVEEQTNDAAAAPERDANAPATEDEAGFYRASEVIGTQVKGDDGQSLGRINDLLIDGKSQQIRYFILSDGDKVDANSNARTPAAQSSSNVTVVPWSVARPQFGRTPDSRFVTVPFAQTRLREAPSYTWQEIQTAPTRWVPDVNRFYNVQGGGVAVPPDSRVRIQRDGDVKIKRDND